MRRLNRTIRKRIWLVLAILVCLAWILGYGLWPVFQSLVAGDASDRDMTVAAFNDRLMSHLMTAIFTFWFFAVGATIGSFLNVVVYRLPLGKSVVFKPSHCPYCKSAIKAYHNVPVLGWLALNGRCRVCHLPISARYPLVEFICGLVFLALLFAEPISGGGNLPFREINEKTGMVRTLFDPQWDLIGATLFHLFLFCVLLSGSLIHWDRQRIPARFWITAAVVGVGASCFFPHLQFVWWQLPFAVPPGKLSSVEAAIGSVAGGLCGTLVGWLVSRIVAPLARSRSFLRWPIGIPISLGILGLFLGWQAILSIAFLSLTTGILISLFFRGFGAWYSMPWFMWISLIAFVHHVFWRPISMTVAPESIAVASGISVGELAAVLLFAMLFRLALANPAVESSTEELTAGGSNSLGQ